MTTEDIPLIEYELDTISSLQAIRPFPNPHFPFVCTLVRMSRLTLPYIRWHWHEDLELILVTSGCVHLQLSAESLDLQTGEGLFINQNIMHRISKAGSDDCEFFCIRFYSTLLFPSGTTDLANRYFHPVVNSSKLRYLKLTPEDDDTSDILHNIQEVIRLDKERPTAYELSVIAHIYLIWAAMNDYVGVHSAAPPLTKAVLTDNHRVKLAMRFIAEHYVEPLTLDEIAASVHISKSECCRCFKRTIGLSPFGFLMRHRILEAVRKMQRKEAASDTISDLAASVGFNSPSYFIKLFKRFTNMTPLEYREKLLRGGEAPQSEQEITKPLRHLNEN